MSTYNKKTKDCFLLLLTMVFSDGNCEKYMSDFMYKIILLPLKHQTVCVMSFLYANKNPFVVAKYSTSALRM